MCKILEGGVVHLCVHEPIVLFGFIFGGMPETKTKNQKRLGPQRSA